MYTKSSLCKPSTGVALTTLLMFFVWEYLVEVQLVCRFTPHPRKKIVQAWIGYRDFGRVNLEAHTTFQKIVQLQRPRDQHGKAQVQVYQVRETAWTHSMDTLIMYALIHWKSTQQLTHSAVVKCIMLEECHLCDAVTVMFLLDSSIHSVMPVEKHASQHLSQLQLLVGKYILFLGGTLI